jgi:type I restriction enzyme, R subunit
MQIAQLLEMRSVENYQEKLIGIADELSKKYTIPEVLQAKLTIENLKNQDFYKELSQKKLDQIREEIRELVKYLETASRKMVYTDIEDSELTIIDDERESYSIKNNQMYKKRVERFIRDHIHQLTISKLSSNLPITKEELKVLEDILFDDKERGSREDFNKEYGEEPLGKFVRSILGLDIEAANKAFADFLQAGNLRADQMTFITNIITYLTKNGVIDKSMLFEPPFTDVNDQGLLGVFDDADAFKIIRIIDEINGNAKVV